MIVRVILSLVIALLYASAVQAGDAENRNTAGEDKELAEAFSYFRNEAQRGDADAQFTLGKMYSKGVGVAQDYKEAVRWYRLAAAQGVPGAQVNLGNMYSKGQGVAQDYAEAVRVYKVAAAQGHPQAQYNLGVLYDRGEGVKQDYAEAVRWYKLAAAQGDENAQVNLGLMYRKGQGVAQNYAEAVRWYTLAAPRNSVARHDLGDMYVNGQGVARDYKKAYMWLSLAGYKDSLQSRETIAAKMTPQEVVEAQRMARACEAGNFENCDVRRNLFETAKDEVIATCSEVKFTDYTPKPNANSISLIWSDTKQTARIITDENFATSFGSNMSATAKVARRLYIGNKVQIDQAEMYFFTEKDNVQKKILWKLDKQSAILQARNPDMTAMILETYKCVKGSMSLK